MSKGNSNFENFTNNGVVNFRQANRKPKKDKKGKASPKSESLAFQVKKTLAEVFCKTLEIILITLSLILAHKILSDRRP
jgi:hypothetical protein